MRVLFVEPMPSLDWSPGRKERIGGRRHPAVTVSGEQVYSYLNLSAAAVLRENGFDVDYIHCQTNGVDFSSLCKKMRSLSPGLVVINSQHVTLPVEFDVARFAKEINAVTLFVGPFATALNKQVFSLCKFVDVVAVSEFDYTALDVAKAVAQKKGFSSVKGIIFRKGKSIVETQKRGLVENLDDLPIPAYDLVDLKKFFESVNLRLPVANTITSRGCPYNCIFCTFPNTIYSHKFRSQSPERVLEEASFLKDSFGIRELRYDDDTFEVDRKRVMEICGLFKKNSLGLTWSNQSRPDLMTGELCNAMAGAGCVRLLFGTESGSDFILQKICKGMTTSQIETGLKHVKEAGIMRHTCFIFGWPWDSMETMRQTMDFAFRINAEFTQFTIATPLPGTPYFSLAQKNNWLSGNYWERDSFNAAGVNLPNISKEGIEEFAGNAYNRYYLRPEYLSMMAKTATRSFDHLKLVLRLSRAFVARKIFS